MGAFFPKYIAVVRRGCTFLVLYLLVCGKGSRNQIFWYYPDSAKVEKADVVHFLTIFWHILMVFEICQKFGKNEQKALFTGTAGITVLPLISI